MHMSNQEVIDSTVRHWEFSSIVVSRNYCYLPLWMRIWLPSAMNPTAVQRFLLLLRIWIFDGAENWNVGSCLRTENMMKLFCFSWIHNGRFNSATWSYQHADSARLLMQHSAYIFTHKMLDGSRTVDNASRMFDVRELLTWNLFRNPDWNDDRKNCIVELWRI